MRENGLMIKLMEKGGILIQMGLYMTESGLWISRKVMELNIGQMVLTMKEILRMEAKKEKDCSNLLMVLNTKENSIKMRLVALEHIHGVMESTM